MPASPPAVPRRSLAARLGPLRPAEVMGYLRTPEGIKLLRYSAASIVSLVVSVACLAFFDGVLRWEAVVSSTVATAIATVPSYHLNRKWAWAKSGRGHLWREVVPFWVIAFIGWGFSTLCVAGAAGWAQDHHVARLVHTLLVAVVYVAAFGVLWIGKFVFFNKVLFAHPGEPSDPVVTTPAAVRPRPAMARRAPVEVGD